MPIYLPGETVPAGKLQALGGIRTDFAPDLTSAGTQPTLGTGALQEGDWTRQGDWCVGCGYIQFGTAGVVAGTSTYFVEAPVPILDTGMLKRVVGSGQVIDASAVDIRLINVYWLSGDAQRFRLTVEGAGDITAASPWTWAANDQLAWSFRFPAIWS